MSDPIFAKGIFYNEANRKAPDWVMGVIKINVADFLLFLQEHAAEKWVNLDVKRSKGGKIYLQLNTWRPSQRVSTDKEDREYDRKFDEGFGEPDVPLASSPEEDLPF